MASNPKAGAAPMRHAMLFAALISGCMAAHPLPASAQENPEAAYAATLQALTPEEKENLASLEKDYLTTIEADLNLAKTSFELKHCIERLDTAIGKNPPRYSSQFETYASSLQADHQAAREKIL